MLTYFSNSHDRDPRQHGAGAAVRRDGGLGADRIPLPRHRRRWRCFSSIGIMVPIRLGSVAILNMMRVRRPQRHADGADPGLCRAGPAAVDLHPERVHPADPARPARRRALRRRAGNPHLPRGGRAVAAARHRHRRRLHHRADLERPVVPADPDVRATGRIRSRSACSSFSANTSPTGIPCSPRCRWRSCRSS